MTTALKSTEPTRTLVIWSHIDELELHDTYFLNKHFWNFSVKPFQLVLLSPDSFSLSKFKFFQFIKTVTIE